MVPETVADLVVADDHPDRAALVAPGDRDGSDGERAESPAPDREYDYRRLRTDAKKTGNFLRHLGVAEGRRVAVAPDRAPEPVLAVLGTALLGGVVEVVAPGRVEARAAVAPTDRVGAYDLPAGGRRAGYGEAPGDPGVENFGKGVWSENPTFPPPDVAPTDPLLAAGGRTLTHAAVVERARGVADRLDAGDTVAVRAGLSDPRAVVAGVVAPLLAGATVLVVPDDVGSPTGSVAVATGSAPEPRVVAPGEVDAG